MNEVETNYEQEIESLTNPARVWSRSEVLAQPNPIPASPGVYAWYFREPPWPALDVRDCVIWNGLSLLYVGIAPKRPSLLGTRPSSQTVRHRVRYHYTGNAEGSTLRLSLGCLLADRLGIELRRVGSGNRMTFSDGESALSDWMDHNALVCWITHPQPWTVEEYLIRTRWLPLNLDQNSRHAFHSTLTQVRAAAKARARQLPALEG